MVFSAFVGALGLNTGHPGLARGEKKDIKEGSSLDTYIINRYFYSGDIRAVPKKGVYNLCISKKIATISLS